MRMLEKLKCPAEKCRHWSEATKYPRKCYYEPQCWRGWLLGIEKAKEAANYGKQKR